MITFVKLCVQALLYWITWQPEQIRCPCKTQFKPPQYKSEKVNSIILSWILWERKFKTFTTVSWNINTFFNNDIQIFIKNIRMFIFGQLWYYKHIATFGSILYSQLSWESGKFQFARWSQTVALWSSLDHPPTAKLFLSMLFGVPTQISCVQCPHPNKACAVSPS